MTENENGANSQQDHDQSQAEVINPRFPTPLNDALRRIVESDMIFFSGSSLASYVRSERQRLSELKELRERINHEQE